MRTKVIRVPAALAVALLGVSCLAARPAAAAPAAESRDHKAATAKPTPPDPAAELLEAVRSLSAQVEAQTKLIGQLQRRLDDYGKQINGRLMATCLAAMTSVPSPNWGFPIGKGDKAGILEACTRSDGWKATYFDTSHAALEMFAPFR